MKQKGSVFLFILILAVWNAGFVFSQNSEPPHIENTNVDTISYCSDSILVVPEITIKNIEINEANEGMKISIANYKRGEDILVYDKVTGFNYKWFDYYGYLEIKGIATAEEYQSAVRKVYYKNIANVPNLDTRSFSISLLDADYLPQTEHFYRYIKKRGILWTEARDSAANMNYYGLKGYLTTITSSIENDFIWSKIDGVGWIGATDSLTEGTWKWVTGPEKGTVFWQGNYDGGSVGGQYSFWNSREPNNVQKSWGDDEDYAHINSNPNTIQKSWNDLPNEGDKNRPNGHYYPEGFIVEFGGMEGDPEVKLSATAVIKVSKIAFSDVRDFEICQGDIQQLNIETSEKYSYTWLPDENISFANVSNPFVTPGHTETYTAIGQLGSCVDSASFTVVVNPVPKHSWDSIQFFCEGASIELDPGTHSSFLWENMETTQTITVSDEDWYTVELTNEFGCTNIDSTHVKRSIIPELDFSELKTLVCGEQQQTINLKFKDGTASTYLTPLQTGKSRVSNETSLSPTVQVDEFGVYGFQLEVTDQNDCVFNDTLEIEFHNQPTAQFQIDSAKCQGYNLDLSFTGTTIEPAIFTWYSNDSIFATGNNLTEINIPLGYGLRDRTVGLKVNEQGCVNSTKIPVIVTPKMNFWVEENPEGCTPLEVKFGNSDVEDIEKYKWDFGDGDSALVERPVHLYTNPGVEDVAFNVQLTVVSAEGCENSGILNDTITVHPIPTVDFDFEENICYNSTATVWYNGSGNANDTYYWGLTGFEPGEIIQNPGESPGPFEFNRTSNPIVEIGIQVTSEFGCETGFFSKTFSRKPIFNVELDKTEGCLPLDIEFTATTLDLVDEVNYNWTFGDGNSKVGEIVTNKFLQDDKKYDIEIIAKSDLTGCSDTLILAEEVFVYPQPKAIFTANPPSVIISNPAILFENTSENATFYEWDFGDNSAFSDKENPTHRYSEMGFFDVKLSVSNDFVCVDTFTQQISVAFDKIFPPNAFSPNANLPEDKEFRIYSNGIIEEGYRLLIFNRWGEIIFESLSQEKGWDGKMKNDNFAPAGVYTWVLQFKDFRSKNYKQHGTVTLLF